MPELSVQLILFVVCVGAFTAAAAIWDLRTRRIPNKLTIPALCAGLVYQGLFNGLGRPGLADAGLGFLLGFGVLFILWMIGGGGGGDVKLMGALSVWLGFRMTLMVLICSSFFVMIGTFSVMVWSLIARGVYQTKNKYLPTGKTVTKRKHPPKETVAQRQKRRIMAYALPVALSTWVIVIWKLPTFPF